MKKVKIAKCKCGHCVILVSIMPDAEINKTSQAQFAKLAKEGHAIKVVTLKSFQRMPFMECSKCYSI